MTYQVPQHIDKNKIFIVQRSEIEGRLDPSVYKPSFRYISKLYPNVKLSSIAYINPRTNFTAFSDDDIISFIPMESIDERVGEIKNLLTKSVKEIKGFTRFMENDLLWAKITPCMQNGKSAIASNLLHGYGCGSTEFYVIRPKTQNVLVEYLHFLLHSPKILEAAQNYFGGSAGQQRVSINFLETFNVPLLPIHVQKELLDLLNQARTIRKQKESEAQKLLESIANDVLTELGISLPHIEKALSKRIFTASFKQLLSNRFDPKGVLLLGDHSGSAIFENIALKHIARINKGNALTSKEADLTGPYPVIAGGKTSPYNHSEANYQGNVITVSASGAYAGYVWYHDYPIYATDCCVIQSKDENQYLTSYLYEVLHAQQERIYMYQQGAGQPHVYASDLEKLLIPKISLDQQKAIVAHAQELRAKAKVLQAEGKAILERAKKEVEKMIIG